MFCVYRSNDAMLTICNSAFANENIRKRQHLFIKRISTAINLWFFSFFSLHFTFHVDGILFWLISNAFECINDIVCFGSYCYSIGEWSECESFKIVFIAWNLMESMIPNLVLGVCYCIDFCKHCIRRMIFI